MTILQHLVGLPGKACVYTLSIHLTVLQCSVVRTLVVHPKEKPQWKWQQTKWQVISSPILLQVAHNMCVLSTGPGAVSEVNNGTSRRAGCIWLLPLLVLHLLLKFWWESLSLLGRAAATASQYNSTATRQRQVRIQWNSENHSQWDRNSREGNKQYCGKEKSLKKKRKFENCLADI